MSQQTTTPTSPTFHIIKNIWSRCPEDDTSHSELSKVIEKKNKIITEKTVRNIKLEGKIVRLEVDNIRWQNDIEELKDELEYYKKEYYRLENGRSSQDIIRYRFPIDDERIIKRMIKNDWLEIKRLCKTARIKAKKNGENPWCHIDLEDDTFVISSRSVKVNEDLQYMVSVSSVYHDTRIHNELFDKKKSGEYKNKPALTIEIENSDSEEDEYQEDSFEDESQEETDEDDDETEEEDTIEEVKEKTLDEVIKATTSRKLRGRLRAGYCSPWWEDNKIKSSSHDFIIKWADNVSSDSDDAETLGTNSRSNLCIEQSFEINKGNNLRPYPKYTRFRK